MEKEGRISRASNSEEMKTRQRRNCAAKIFCCALFSLFFPLVFCFWTTTTWKKERAPRTLREKRAEENFYRFCVQRKRLRNQDKPSANFEIHLVPYSPPIFIPQCLCIKVVEVLRASPMFGNPKRALKHPSKHTQWVVNVLRSCNPMVRTAYKLTFRRGLLISVFIHICIFRSFWFRFASNATHFIISV